MVVKLSRGAYGKAAAQIKAGAFKPWNVTSGGNNINDFLDNQLTKTDSVDRQKETIYQ